jgi:uncharacterized protein (TIGR02001 family)
MIRLLSSALALLVVLAAPAVASAQAQSPWSASFGAGTDNRSKALSKSDGDPYAWGEVQWESASGFFYAGPQVETIKSSTGAELEAAFSVGVRPQVGGFDLDLNAEHKWHVDADPGVDDAAWEFTADLKRSIGPASARLRVQYSPDSTGSTEAWTWVALRGGWAFTDKLTGSLEVGRREQDNAVDYTGWNLGLNYALTRNVAADLRYHANDADLPGEQYADALVAGVSFAF